MADEYICELVSHGNGLWEYEPTGVQIVRCKDCKYYDKFKGVHDGGCRYYGIYTDPEDFCSRGARIDEVGK